MKGRSILLLALSAVLGVLAIALVRGMMPGAPVATAADTRAVVVAAKAL